jgi:hypothetical protein
MDCMMYPIRKWLTSEGSERSEGWLDRLRGASSVECCIGREEVNDHVTSILGKAREVGSEMLERANCKADKREAGVEHISLSGMENKIKKYNSKGSATRSGRERSSLAVAKLACSLNESSLVSRGGRPPERVSERAKERKNGNSSYDLFQFP